MSERFVTWYLTWTSKDGTETQTQEFTVIATMIAKLWFLLATKGGSATISQTPPGT